MTDIERLQGKGLSKEDKRALEALFAKMEITPSSGTLTINFNDGHIASIQPSFMIR